MGVQHIFAQVVIDHLAEYKSISGRIKYLEQTPIGYGLLLESNNEDDKLKDLHRKLKLMPSHMYLNKSEQELESFAFAYLDNYSLGTKSQLQDVKNMQISGPDDLKQLKLLQNKIARVIDARNGETRGIKGVEKRISELQDLQHKLSQIELALNTLDWINPDFGRLLKFRYIDKEPVDEVIHRLCISRKTYDRWRNKAIIEYAKLTGIMTSYSSLT